MLVLYVFWCILFVVEVDVVVMGEGEGVEVVV